MGVAAFPTPAWSPLNDGESPNTSRGVYCENQRVNLPNGVDEQKEREQAEAHEVGGDQNLFTADAVGDYARQLREERKAKIRSVRALPMTAGVILPALALLAAPIFSACSRASSNTLAAEHANVERLSKIVFTKMLGAYPVYSPLKVVAL